MITEDYCSYEVAKLLKEKGFDCWCEHYIFENYEDYKSEGTGSPTNWNKYGGHTSIPSLSLAMKWLREVHNLCIAPYAAAYRYGFTIDKCDTGSNICNDDVINEELITYEEAVDAALKYCLTELI